MSALYHFYICLEMVISEMVYGPSDLASVINSNFPSYDCPLHRKTFLWQLVLQAQLELPKWGNVATPINSSAVARTYINNLPAYRAGLSPFSRGLEVGVAHGYWFYGPFAVLGPLRASDYSAVAGVIAAISFVFILTVAISIYSATSPDGPEGTLTTPNPPEAFSTREGWSNFASGFLVGGLQRCVLCLLALPDSSPATSAGNCWWCLVLITLVLSLELSKVSDSEAC